VSVFVRYNNTPIIMASGRELCYVLMVGMLLCYAMTFVMVSKPTLLTCALSRAGLGLSLALCYSALFTKTNRISRIFNRGLKAMVKRPSYTSPRSQLAICSYLAQVLLLTLERCSVVSTSHRRCYVLSPSYSGSSLCVQNVGALLRISKYIKNK